jgi:ATPase family associated with various cellular activities (AAA)
MTIEDRGDASFRGTGEVLARLEPQRVWSELVLPEEQTELLRGVASRFRVRYQTGLRSLDTGTGGGLKGLLTGEAGTGKRLAGRTLGAELGLDVVHVDAATLAAGDRAAWSATLKRILTAAGTEEIVFLDRVEQLFPAPRPGAPRSDEPEAERAELLREIDAHPGMILFASVLRAQIAPALLGLLDFEVDLPFPEPEARAKIWRFHLPPNATVDAATIDYLADAFQLSGGAIDRCVTVAAQAAARDGVPIGLPHVVEVLEHELGNRLISARTREAIAALRERLPAAPASGVNGRAAPERVVEPEKPPRVEPPPSVAELAPVDDPEPVIEDTPVINRQPGPTRGAPAERLPPPAPPRSSPEPARPSPAPAWAAASPAATPVSVAEAAHGRETASHAGARPARATAAGSRRGPLAGLAVGLAIAAAVGGVFLAQALFKSSSSAIALDRHTSTSAVAVSYPRTWQSKTPPAKPALGLSGGLAVAPSGTGSAGRLLVLGMAQPSGPSLLPDPILKGIAHLSPGQVAVLGGTRFYRYLDQSFNGIIGSVSLYALPTSAGTIVGLCEQPSSDSSFAGTCERIVGTARPVSGNLVTLQPSQSYATQLTAAMRELASTRSRELTALGRAGTNKAQAAAAAALATTYLDTAKTAAGLKPGQASAENSALALALRRVADAYAAASRAAARHDSAAYASAGSAVSSANGKLDAAVAALGKLGYAIG